MKKVALLLQEMVSTGVITSYAIFGAVAQMRYTEAVLREAVVEDFEGVPLRVVRADFLAMIALDAGRAKDFDRIVRMMEAGAISLDGLQELAERHGLSIKLRAFKSRHRK